MIPVTHSMGGLVGWRAVQLAPDKVLGVVHGVPPVAAIIIFGHIHWQTSGGIPNDDVLPLIYPQDRQRSLTGKSTVPLYGETGSPEVKFKLGNERDQGGDGTVPLDSAKVLAQLQPPPKAVFRITGFDHQMSYKNPYAIQATVYGIAKLVQLAAPATPY